MVGACLHIVTLILLLPYMHAARVSEIPVINSGREPKRSLDGTVICTGHQMEDNFEANLAAATSSK